MRNSVCEILQWYSNLSIVQIHSKLKHLVSYENTLFEKLKFIIVDDPSYYRCCGWAL